jgi:hypothetical protein
MVYDKKCLSFYLEGHIVVLIRLTKLRVFYCFFQILDPVGSSPVRGQAFKATGLPHRGLQPDDEDLERKSRPETDLEVHCR